MHRDWPAHIFPGPSSFGPKQPVRSVGRMLPLLYRCIFFTCVHPTRAHAPTAISDELVDVRRHDPLGCLSGWREPLGEKPEHTDADTAGRRNTKKNGVEIQNRASARQPVKQQSDERKEK